MKTFLKCKLLLIAVLLSVSVNAFLRYHLKKNLYDADWTQFNVKVISGMYETRRVIDNKQSWVGGKQINCNFPSLLPFGGRTGECGAGEIPGGTIVRVALIEVPTVFDGNIELVMSIRDEVTIYIQRDIEYIRGKCIDASTFSLWNWTVLIVFWGFIPFAFRK